MRIHHVLLLASTPTRVVVLWYSVSIFLHTSYSILREYIIRRRILRARNTRGITNSLGGVKSEVSRGFCHQHACVSRGIGVGHPTVILSNILSSSTSLPNRASCAFCKRDATIP